MQENVQEHENQLAFAMLWQDLIGPGYIEFYINGDFSKIEEGLKKANIPEQEFLSLCDQLNYDAEMVKNKHQSIYFSIQEKSLNVLKEYANESAIVVPAMVADNGIEYDVENYKDNNKNNTINNTRIKVLKDLKEDLVNKTQVPEPKVMGA